TWSSPATRRPRWWSGRRSTGGSSPGRSPAPARRSCCVLPGDGDARPAPRCGKSRRRGWRGSWTVVQDAGMKRRDLIRMTDDEVRAFLAGRHTMNVATMNHDGTIHLVAMWYGFVGDDTAFWTYGKSQKIRNLERNPQITCLVEAGERYEELQG